MKRLVTLFALFFMTSVWAISTSIHPDVEKIIMQISPPKGVVIEVESLSEDAMSEYLSTIQTQVNTLRQRYPDLDIVVVSHGRELDAFAKPKQGDVASDVVQAFQTMSSAQNVTVHVCGVVAGWQGKTDQDFVDYVDVSASGEAQINDYKALGYDVVVIERLSDEERKTLQPKD